MSAAEIEKSLGDLDGWKAENNKLKKRFAFANFAESMTFVNRAGEIAERRDHHPDIAFGWGYAEFFIMTHDSGGITALDFALAKEIDRISIQ